MRYCVGLLFLLSALVSGGCMTAADILGIPCAEVGCVEEPAEVAERQYSEEVFASGAFGRPAPQPWGRTASLQPQGGLW